MSTKAVRIEVSGRVQGVFFRVSTKEVCEKIGVKGWVKNLPTGSVLIHAEGSDEQLKELIEWCNEGPLLSNVTKVDSEDAEMTNAETFEVLR